MLAQFGDGFCLHHAGRVYDGLDGDHGRFGDDAGYRVGGQGQKPGCCKNVDPDHGAALRLFNFFETIFTILSLLLCFAHKNMLRKSGVYIFRGFSIMMSALGQFLLFCLDVYFYIIVVEVVVSWLIVFDVVNLRSPQAQNFLRLLRKATDPVMAPLRKVIPAIGGIDISPIIVIFAIFMLKGLVARMFLVY